MRRLEECAYVVLTTRFVVLQRAGPPVATNEPVAIAPNAPPAAEIAAADDADGIVGSVVESLLDQVASQ